MNGKPLLMHLFLQWMGIICTRWIFVVGGKISENINYMITRGCQAFSLWEFPVIGETIIQRPLSHFRLVSNIVESFCYFHAIVTSKCFELQIFPSVWIKQLTLCLLTVKSIHHFPPTFWMVPKDKQRIRNFTNECQTLAMYYLRARNRQTLRTGFSPFRIVVVTLEWGIEEKKLTITWLKLKRNKYSTMSVQSRRQNWLKVVKIVQVYHTLWKAHLCLGIFKYAPVVAI